MCFLKTQIWMIVLMLVNTISCENCPVHTDSQGIERTGFHCPPAIRLVGRSDFYCCCCTDGQYYCCKDRIKSLTNFRLSYDDEWIQINWPLLMMFGVIFGFVVILPYLSPRPGTVKHEVID